MTLVMIHGLVGSLHYFDPQSRISSAEVRCCDLLGYGRWRDVKTDRLTLSSQVEYVARTIDQMDRRPVCVLGHSMGGAIALLLADRYPDLVAGIINVEGNFTAKDAFWSTKIIRKSPQEWQDEYRAMESDLPGWLGQCSITPTEQRIRWAKHILSNQPAETVYRMSKSLVEDTLEPAYMDAVRRVVDSNIPLHLIAGRKSAAGWDVPGFVRDAARSYVEQPDVGHLMMLENPDAFCRIVSSVLDDE